MKNIFEHHDDGLDCPRGITCGLLIEAGIAVAVYLIVMASVAFGATIHPERFYQERFCAGVGGKMEETLRDRTRVDCLTPTYAWEVNFAPKWAEAIGQSLHYAKMTGRRPGIVLIIETPGDLKYIERLTNTVKTLNVDIELRLVRP